MVLKKDAAVDQAFVQQRDREFPPVDDPEGRFQHDLNQNDFLNPSYLDELFDAKCNAWNISIKAPQLELMFDADDCNGYCLPQLSSPIGSKNTASTAPSNDSISIAYGPSNLPLKEKGRAKSKESGSNSRITQVACLRAGTSDEAGSVKPKRHNSLLDSSSRAAKFSLSGGHIEIGNVADLNNFFSHHCGYLLVNPCRPVAANLIQVMCPERKQEFPYQDKTNPDRLHRAPWWPKETPYQSPHRMKRRDLQSFICSFLMLPCTNLEEVEAALGKGGYKTWAELLQAAEQGLDLRDDKPSKQNKRKASDEEGHFARLKVIRSMYRISGFAYQCAKGEHDASDMTFYEPMPEFLNKEMKRRCTASASRAEQVDDAFCVPSSVTDGHGGLQDYMLTEESEEDTPLISAVPSATPYPQFISIERSEAATETTPRSDATMPPNTWHDYTAGAGDVHLLGNSIPIFHNLQAPLQQCAKGMIFDNTLDEGCGHVQLQAHAAPQELNNFPSRYCEQPLLCDNENMASENLVEEASCGNGCTHSTFGLSAIFPQRYGFLASGSSVLNPEYSEPHAGYVILPHSVSAFAPRQPSQIASENASKTPQRIYCGAADYRGP